jgi:hypothetical protein
MEESEGEDRRRRERANLHDQGGLQLVQLALELAGILELMLERMQRALQLGVLDRTRVLLHGQIMHHLDTSEKLEGGKKQLELHMQTNIELIKVIKKVKRNARRKSSIE